MGFDADTAVHGDRDARYRATVSDRWDIPGRTPNGGYLLALAVRAMAGELPHPDPVAVSAVFTRPGSHGPADLTVQVLRTGRQLSYATVVLRQHGQDVLHGQAAFADLTVPQGPVLARNPPPALPAPEQCLDLRAGPGRPVPPGVTIVDQVEYRAAQLPGWATGTPSGDPSAQLWLRLRDGTPPTTLALPLLVDAMPPVLLELGYGSTTVQLTVHVRARPAAGWLSCCAATRTVAAGLHEEDLDLWDSTGRLVAQSRQLGLVLPPA